MSVHFASPTAAMAFSNTRMDWIIVGIVDGHGRHKHNNTLSADLDQLNVSIIFRVNCAHGSFIHKRKIRKETSNIFIQSSYQVQEHTSESEVATPFVSK